MNSTEKVHVGVDVCKARLDVALLPSGETFAVANDEDGIQTLVEKLREVEPALVVLEATGGLERPLVAAFFAASIALRRSSIPARRGISPGRSEGSRKPTE